MAIYHKFHISYYEKNNNLKFKSVELQEGVSKEEIKGMLKSKNVLVKEKNFYDALHLFDHKFPNMNIEYISYIEEVNTNKEINNLILENDK